ncbi:lytic transglycosylase domain-containing protein [Bradyrhizobium erythrophlei]|uniref:lytic transglycosylase domain-containing protein n=1 Tax=Bradyrhizobium erythrophlei TaxID=1437360 RepID=UPI0035E84568
MTLFVQCFLLAIPLLDQLRNHSSIPTNDRGAVARCGGPGRPNGRREAALAWTEAGTGACLSLLEVCVCAVVPLLLALTMNCDPARADEQAVAHPRSAQSNDPFEHFINEASLRFAVPTQWIRSVLRIESAGDVRARSGKGAMGLMQVMPETWAELRLRYALGEDPYDPRDNILAGTAYLRELYDRYGLPGTFAAYNAGPARYEKHLAGDPLPAETNAYLTDISALVGTRSASIPVAGPRSWRASPIFLVHSERAGIPNRQQGGRASNPPLNTAGTHELSAIVPKAAGLFVARSDAGEQR